MDRAEEGGSRSVGEMHGEELGDGQGRGSVEGKVVMMAALSSDGGGARAAAATLDRRRRL